MSKFLLWCESDKKRTIADIADTIEAARTWYAQKFWREANLCFVPIASPSVEIEGVECVPNQYLMWPHIQVGVKSTTPG